MKFIKYSAFLLTFFSLSYIIADEKKGTKVKVRNYLSKIKNKGINPSENPVEKVITKTDNTNIEVLQMKSEPGSNNIIINVITNDKETKNTKENNITNTSPQKNKAKNIKKFNRKTQLSKKINKKKNIKQQETIKEEIIEEKKPQQKTINPQSIENKEINKQEDNEEIEYIVKEEYVDESGNLVKTNTRPASEGEIQQEKGIKPSASNENLKLNKKLPMFDKE